MAKKKKEKRKKAAGKTSKKRAAKKNAAKKAPTKAAGKKSKGAPKKSLAKKKAPARKTAGKPSSSSSAGGAIAPMLPGMADGLETDEFEPEVGLVADVDDEEDEEVDFPENEEIVVTPDLEKHGDDDEGEW